jgi:hypothetical protein
LADKVIRGKRRTAEGERLKTVGRLKGQRADVRRGRRKKEKEEGRRKINAGLFSEFRKIMRA